MAFLEYATLTVTTLVPRYVPSFLDKDPAWKAIRAAGKMRPAYGPKFRFRRVKGNHSDPTEITDSQLTVNLNRKEVFGYLEGDWPKIIQPIILPHGDRDRLMDKSEVKTWVDKNTKAALAGMSIALRRRTYNGSGGPKNAYLGFSTLNGNNTSGTRSGFENGALRFQSPADQAAAGVTFLGETRQVDTVDFTNNWYNQYKQHNGIDVDFLDAVREVKALADSFAGDEPDDGSSDGEMNMGVMTITDQLGLSKAIRQTGSGGASLVYTVDDVAKGRVMPNIEIACGVRFYSNRFMDSSSSGINVTEPCYLLTPDSFEWWVWNKYDFSVSAFFDGLKVGNTDADVAYITTAMQWAPIELLRNGCVGQ